MHVEQEQKGKILIIGKNGQVSRALQAALGQNCIALGRDILDIGNIGRLYDRIDAYAPIAIINAAAYTAVDKAEEEERLAFVINGDAPGELALYAFSNDIPFIHYSSDYVFSGEGNAPMPENSALSPINSYGRSKLDGEMKIQAAASKFKHPKWYIFRTSWVYDEDGQNFINTMLRLGSERQQLNVVNDQIGAPTYAGDLAKYTVLTLMHGMQQSIFPSGIFHLCNKGETSWHGFAQEIFALLANMQIDYPLQVRSINKINTAEYPTPAKRPLNSRLNTDLFEQHFALTLPTWQDALKRCMSNKFANNPSFSSSSEHKNIG